MSGETWKSEFEEVTVIVPAVKLVPDNIYEIVGEIEPTPIGPKLATVVGVYPNPFVVPVTATVGGVFTVPPEKVTFPDVVPNAVGVNLMYTVADNVVPVPVNIAVDPHVLPLFEIWNPEGAVPVILPPEGYSVPPFKVNVCAVELQPVGIAKEGNEAVEANNTPDRLLIAGTFSVPPVPV